MGPEPVGRLDRSARPAAAPGVTQLFIDVGVEKPIDVALLSVDLKPQSVPANREVVLKATVAATGQPCDAEILCRLVGETAAGRLPVKLDAGQSSVVEFRKKNLKPGQYQAEITLLPTDALPGDNARFVTFEVRGPRQTLVITDDKEYAFLWQAALGAYGEFACEVKAPRDVASPDDLKPYLAVVLLSVRAPNQPTDDSLWVKLDKYVKAGGNLLVLPGRDDLSLSDYNESKAAAGLLPGKFEKIIDMPGEKGRSGIPGALPSTPCWRSFRIGIGKASVS